MSRNKVVDFTIIGYMKNFECWWLINRIEANIRLGCIDCFYKQNNEYDDTVFMIEFKSGRTVIVEDTDWIRVRDLWLGEDVGKSSSGCNDVAYGANGMVIRFD
jgi:hypothetical protein